MTSFHSLRQVHLSDDLSDLILQSCPRLHPSPLTNVGRLVRAAGMQPHLFRPFTRNSRLTWAAWAATWTEIVQNQPNKSFFSLFFSVSKQVQLPPRRHQGHLEQTYSPGTKFQLSAGFESSGGTETVAAATPSSTWKSRAKKKKNKKKHSDERLPNFSHQGSKHQRNTSQQYSPTLTCLDANEMITCSHLTNQQQSTVSQFFL